MPTYRAVQLKGQGGLDQLQEIELPLMAPRKGLRALYVFTLAVALGLLLQGCATPPRGEAVPTGLETKAMVVGFPDHIRYFPRDPEDIKRIEKEFVDSWSREKEYLRTLGQTSSLPPASYLAISGGGDDGAYGAGFLNGWSQTGTRPEFKLVTGVSTGALTAPFAFLGKNYDPELMLLYTSVSQKDILAKRNLYAAVFGDAMSDTTPLYHLIKKYVTKGCLIKSPRSTQKGACSSSGRWILIPSGLSSGTSRKSPQATAPANSNSCTRFSGPRRPSRAPSARDDQRPGQRTELH